MIIVSKRLRSSITMGVIVAGGAWIISSLAPLYNCNGLDIGIGFLFGSIAMGAMAIYIKFNPLPITRGK